MNCEPRTPEKEIPQVSKPAVSTTSKSADDSNELQTCGFENPRSRRLGSLRHKTTKYLSLLLAGLLQILPLVRSALPSFLNAVRTPMGSLIARWVAGGVAYLTSYHAVSGATNSPDSISISPPSAVQGKFYSGTISWSGFYTGEVQSMAFNGICLGSYSPSPGLTITYNGGATALMQGIPTSSNLFTMTSEINLSTGCPGGFYSTTRTTPKFSIISSNGLYVAPSFNNPPQNAVAVAGTAVTLFGGATGNPLPTYQWERNLVAIAGATNAIYTISNPQFTDAGTYSLVASNVNTNNSPPTTNHPSSFCVLSICVPPGTNFNVLYWTNYVLAGVPITLTSFFTNTPSATNTTYWGVNGSPFLATNQNFSLTAAQAVPSKSGTYSVFFSSVNGTNVYADKVEVDTQWQFGYLPVITNQPTPVTVPAGSNATFTCTLAGGNIPFCSLYQNGNYVTEVDLTNYNPNAATATTNISITLTNVTSSNAGTYTIVINNYWGSTTSAPVALTVESPPTVTSPASHTAYAGKNVNLNVTASGSSPFAFQWQKGGLNLSDGGNLSGSLTSNLDINPAAPANSGNYQVVVANSFGSTTSSVATVSILPVPTFKLSLSGNNAELTASGGVPLSNYVVQISTNIANSNGWISLYTNRVPPNGLISFTDTNALTNLDRFYRVQFP